MFKKILLAVDGSQDSRKAGKVAAEIAQQNDAEVIVVHAIPAVPPMPGHLPEEEMSEFFKREGQEISQETADDLKAEGVDLTVEVVQGPAAEMILEIAKTRQPDLIVMGSRGQGDLSSLLLGSVSHRVLAHAKPPVLVVKAQ